MVAAICVVNMMFLVLGLCDSSCMNFINTLGIYFGNTLWCQTCFLKLEFPCFLCCNPGVVIFLLTSFAAVNIRGDIPYIFWPRIGDAQPS